MGSSKEEIYITVIAGTIAFLLLAVFIVIFVYLHKQRQRRNRMEKIQMQQNFQQELLRSQLEIQEQTLKTISQEIHDNIGQMLSLAKLNLALADAETNSPHPMQQKISDSHQLVKKAIQDLRHLSHSLNTDYVSEMGLQRSIEYELEMISKTGIMKVNLQTEGTVHRLDKQKELIAFRIVQESLNNIIKHAEATKIDITIHYLPSQMLLTIKDNGKGVDLTPLTESVEGFGIGIRNMNNRARLIGAVFNINSSPGNGTTITLHLHD